MQMNPHEVPDTTRGCAVPAAIDTARLRLACWQAADADELLPVLQSNWEHLSPWIPARVATPSPLPELQARLAEYAAKFMANIEWRYAIRDARNYKLLGEVAMFPRSATGRVPLAGADRAELGYWLRSDENGNGYATEATQALLTVARALERFAHFEIRCDPDNTRSAAVPRRLGFSERPSGSETTVLFCLNA